MSDNWPVKALQDDVNMIMTVEKGRSKPPSDQFPEAQNILNVVVNSLSLVPIATLKRGEVVSGFLRKAIDAVDEHRVDKDLNSARELLGFSRYNRAKIEELIERHKSKLPPRAGEHSPDSKAVRLHLAKLEQLDETLRDEAIGRDDPKLIDDKKARAFQEKTWAPAVVDALYALLHEHRDKALILAQDLRLAPKENGGDTNADSTSTVVETERKPRPKTVIWTIVGVAALVVGVFVAVWFANRAPDSGDPYDVNTLTNFDAIESKDQFAGGRYLFSEPIQDVGPPPADADTCYGRYDWAKNKGAIDVGSTLSRVSITARQGHNLQVIGARSLPVGSAKSPAIGSIATCAGKGAVPVRHIAIDLDKGGDKVYYDGVHEEPGELNIPVEGGKTEVIDVAASTLEQDWTYTIELTLVVDGKQEKVMIDNDGKPFRTTSEFNAKHYRWIEGKWFDVTPGSGAEQLPPPNIPVNVPDACGILTKEDASNILGKTLQLQSSIPPAPERMDTGLELAASSCVYMAPDMDLVQLTLMEPPTSDKLQELYNDVLKKVDINKEAKDLPGYTGQTKVIDGSRVLMLHKNRIVDLSITRNGNKSNPLDVDYIKTLLNIAVRRL